MCPLSFCLRDQRKLRLTPSAPENRDSPESRRVKNLTRLLLTVNNLSYISRGNKGFPRISAECTELFSPRPKISVGVTRCQQTIIDFPYEIDNGKSHRVNGGCPVFFRGLLGGPASPCQERNPHQLAEKPGFCRRAGYSRQAFRILRRRNGLSSIDRTAYLEPLRSFQTLYKISLKTSIASCALNLYSCSNSSSIVFILWE